MALVLSDDKEQRTRRIVYDPSIGLTVGYTDQIEKDEAKEATPEEEMMQKLKAVAISGGWVYLTGEGDRPYADS